MTLYQLGKRPAKIDRRTFKLSKYIKALPPPPERMGYIEKVRDWPMMLNDAIGDCTIAAAGHMIEQWTTYAAGVTSTPTDAEVLRAYEAVSGYNPNDPLSDNGATVLDVLKYWRGVGIGGHRIAAFAAINLNSAVEFQQAVYLFGNAYLGVGLPVTAQDPRVDGNGLPVWEVPPQGPRGDGLPWTWGGHAIPAVGYKTNRLNGGGLRVVSWGQLYDVTWNFLKAYCDEAFAVVTFDWIKANQKSPSGFDINTLTSDLALL